MQMMVQIAGSLGSRVDYSIQRIESTAALACLYMIPLIGVMAQLNREIASMAQVQKVHDRIRGRVAKDEQGVLIELPAYQAADVQEVWGLISKINKEKVLAIGCQSTLIAVIFFAAKFFPSWGPFFKKYITLYSLALNLWNAKSFLDNKRTRDSLRENILPEVIRVY